MCLVILAIRQSPQYPLIVAANRDEFHERATEGADWWPERTNVYGGRDRQAGGSWLLLHRKGRFATVTNYRDAQPPSSKFRSRGHLVTEFLESDQSPLEYLQQLDGAQYAGFNLIVGDGRRVAYYSNRGRVARELPPGIYGLSNALLDDPWFKVRRSKREIAALLKHDEVREADIFRVLFDRSRGPAEEVDSTRFDVAMGHAITAPFIVTPAYGTRSSTVVRVDRNGTWRMTEQRFDASGHADGESRVRFLAAG